MSGEKPSAFVVVGTRPEAIKLAPVVEALLSEGRIRPVLVATSQHREMLRQALRPFDLLPDVDLDIMSAGQTPTRVATEVLRRFEPLLADRRPAWVVVQGDTTTTFAAAVAAFYAEIPVAHVEAGLRTGRLDSPFPEEFNRRAASVATALHLAPTPGAAANLRAEGIKDDAIVVVGNTAVDAVLRIRRGRPARVQAEPPLVLVTLHRRESFGEPIARVLDALRQLAMENAGRLRLVYPVHPNPNVDQPARQALAGVPGVELLPPLDYPDFLDLFAEARFVLSDSGGVQEEGPTLGVPVLILRDTTERPEVLESGWGKLVGTDGGLILAEARRLLHDDAALAAMKAGPNPFGDGHSGPAIARALADRL
ncbi:MAG TPA: UDP-N-acetylglucosamine 2-epimerase (non-hydrolyzing) [Thermoanaerobaculaceae bacterium]|nr:UDP-N-acetylglucosamine 2-epimerase (non-hydrolyzing) [Thermoanaerobaculaceae bacterium]